MLGARALLWVFLGGGAGSVLRHMLAVAAARAGATAFPVGTLAVNLAGSFLLALAVQLIPPAQRDLRLALGTGLLGGFTTYSTFNLEVLTLAQSGQPGRAGVYALATFAGCLLAGAAGWVTGRALTAG